MRRYHKISDCYTILGKLDYAMEDAWKAKEFFEENTPDMSLAIGIGWYSYKLNMERGKLSERKGVENYNGGGDSEYMEKFNEKMGYINDVLYD